MRRGGTRDGGMSFPQPTQYRPRCSTALQCAHDDDMVPPRTGASRGGSAGRMTGQDDETAQFRTRGRAVTALSPGQAVEEADLTLDQLRAGLLHGEPRRPVDLRELLEATRARWPLQLEGVAHAGPGVEVALGRP